MKAILKQKSLFTLLTILVLSLTAEIVSGCTYDISNGQPNPAIENSFYSGIYFYSAAALILAIIITSLLRRRYFWRWLLVTFSAILIALAVLFFSIIAQDCGHSAAGSLKIIFFSFLGLFVIQIVSWIYQKKKSKFP